MSMLEIIHLRSTGEPLDSLAAEIRASAGAEETGADLLALYRRRGLETDLAVHIRHPDRADRAGRGEPSGFGLRLAAALRAYGLVEHTIWEELP